ncbi:MAG: DMT family transporter [Burkholderiaceae bacterium]
MTRPFQAPGHHALAGIALALTAVACFAALDTTSKRVSAVLPVMMALWFRYLFQAVSTTVMVWPSRGRRILRTAHPRFQLARGALLFLCSTFAFFSLKFMPVGEFTAVVMVTPLAVTLVAATWTKEQVSVLRWLLVIGGFVGVLFIVRPTGDQGLGWAVLLPLGLVIANTGFQILTSKLARLEDPITTHFYTGWVGALLGTVALPFAWAAVPSWHWWAALVFMGLMGTVGHFLLILAYQRAPTSVLTPYLYGQIAFAMLGGYLMFAHVPDAWALLGIGMVAVCGAMGAWLTVREGRVRLEPVES